MESLTQQFIAAHLSEDVRLLALKTAPTGVDLPKALQQITARQLLSKKVPTWASNPHLEFPTHLSLEQCSSEATARYKASLLSGNTLVDLTGGMGVDCYFLSQNFKDTFYVEQQPHLVEFARHNFKVLNSIIRVNEGDSETFLNTMNSVDTIFIDPARRDMHGRKTVSIHDCTPDVGDLQELLLEKAQHVLIKLSPMLDISLALKELQNVKAVYVVAVGNECKELLFLLERNYTDETVIYAENLPESSIGRLSFRLSDEKAIKSAYSSGVLDYLYEPNAAVLKAGAFKTIANEYGIQKLEMNSHLYTSDRFLESFPGRTFKVQSWAVFNNKITKTLLAGITQANITTRNFPLSVKDLRTKLKLKDGGNYYIFATTLATAEKVLILCQKA